MINECNFGYNFLDRLAIEDNFKSKRISSWDRTGNNIDYISINSNEKKIIAEINGAGCIRHIYSTNISLDPFLFRNLVLRIYWDGEDKPSVEVPWGDFFGIGHCRPKLFSSLLLSVNPGNVLTDNRNLLYSYGINCYFPMPFSKSAVVEIENQSDIPIEAFWYHIDYQEYDNLDENILRFHSEFNREKITKVSNEIKGNKNITLWDSKNLTGDENYVILDTKGNGKFIGMILNVDNIAGEWWGEGDDMVFIDKDTWPPSIHGTGTEEIFGGGACPSREFQTPYCGFHLISNTNYFRHNSMYRFFILDPVRFEKSIKYTIEHGHANNFENDYSSIAYWYQREPHIKIKSLSALERRPLLNSAGEIDVINNQISIAKDIYEKPERLFGKPPEILEKLLRTMVKVENFYYESKYEMALNELKFIEKTLL